MNTKKVYLALISTQSPILLGIYYEDIDSSLHITSSVSNTKKILKEKKLFAWFEIFGLVSDILPFIFSNILLDNKDSLHYMNAKFINRLINKFRDYYCKLYFCESRICSNLKSHSNNNFCSLGYIGDIQKVIALLQSIDTIGGIYYARGTGSLSAIKLTHIFLQVLSVTKSIPLYATNIFYFNSHDEMKAFGNQSFFYKDSKIQLGNSINPKTNLAFPAVLHDLYFCEPCEPLYVSNPL